MTDRLSWRWLLALGTLIATSGCSSLDNCPNGQDTPIDIDKGTTDTENFMFESAPWDALDPFPAKTQLSFKHHLGVTPLLVKSYLSFSANGTNGGDDGSVTEVAGNEAPLECVDSQVIVVKNDTCEKSFFIRVVALGSPNGDATNAKCEQ